MVDSNFQSVFNELRAMLRKQAKTFIVNRDDDEYYSLIASVGPATIFRSCVKS